MNFARTITMYPNGKKCVKTKQKLLRKQTFFVGTNENVVQIKKKPFFGKEDAKKNNQGMHSRTLYLAQDKKNYLYKIVLELAINK